MTLVSKAQVLYRHISRPQGSDNLLRFTNRYARIVGAMHDKERRGNPIHGTNGGYLLQKFAVTLQAAVFGLAQLAPPGTRVLQERHEIGDPNDINPCRPQIGVGRQRGQHHESTIAASHYGNATRISDTAFSQVEDCILQILHRIHAQADIIQALVLITVASTPTHIRDKYRVPAGDKVLHNRVEYRARLTFWATMHIHHNWQPSWLSIAREIEKSRYLAAIKRRVAHKRWCNKSCLGNTAQCAACRAPQHASLYIPHPHVGGIICAIDSTRQAAAISRPADLPQHTLRQSRVWCRQRLSRFPTR